MGVYKMGSTAKYCIGFACTFFASASASLASTLGPAPALSSNITLEVGPALQFAEPSNANNLGSPVAIGNTLYIVDQFNGISTWTGGAITPVLNNAAPPSGVTPTGREAFLNITGTETSAFVAFTSSTLPSGITASPLPNRPEYNTTEELYQVIVRYDRAPDGSLSSPTPIAAFERAARGHAGGGMLAISETEVLFATGDGLTQNFNGLEGAQDPNEAVGNLHLINAGTGMVETAAVGLRNTQRLTFANAERSEVALVDIGWTVAEEVNVISVAELTDTSSVENFGWGVAADGRAREGTFYVSEGPEADAEILGEAPLNEAGFIQPYAQFTRSDPSTFFAGSGPVFDPALSAEIDLLFADLRSGDMFATAPGAGSVLNDVFEVNLVDTNGVPIDVLDLTTFGRADIRFFNFADGQAGFLLERQGTAYRLRLIPAAIPLPASGLILLGGLAALGISFRRK